MTYTVHLTLSSTNAKTGPIPVSTTEASTCPPTCGVRDACYAKNGPLSLHWAAVSSGERGMPWDAFCDRISKLQPGSIWRHNQAGDLPGDGTTIDWDALGTLVEANEVIGAHGFTYTHYPMTPDNAMAVAHANARGFTINLSADSLDHADELMKLGVAPVTVVLPSTQRENVTTPQANSVVICPAYTREGTTCASCALCSIATRTAIVGFPAHGSRRRVIDIKLGA